MGCFIAQAYMALKSKNTHSPKTLKYRPTCNRVISNVLFSYVPISCSLIEEMLLYPDKLFELYNSRGMEQVYNYNKM